MSWTDTQVAVSDVLTGRLVVDTLYNADNGKRIVVTGTTTAYTDEKIMIDKRTVFELPAKERYTVEMFSDDAGAALLDYAGEVVLEAGGYARLVIDIASSAEEEEEAAAIGSWEKVKAIIDSHKEAEYFRIGDEIDLYLEDEDRTHHPMLVAAINHDEEYPHQVIFVSKYALPKDYRHNTAATTAGGWVNMSIRTEMNGPAFYDILPESLRSVIAKRKFRDNIGNASGALADFEDYIWFPKNIELFPAYGSALASTAPGSCQFPLFLEQSRRIRQAGENGASISWWTVSGTRQGTSPRRLCTVSTAGTDNGTDAGVCEYTGFYAVPCFHIVAEDTLLKIGGRV